LRHLGAGAVELWRIYRWQLHYRYRDAAIIANELAGQRIRKTPNRVLCAAVRGLLGNSAVGVSRDLKNGARKTESCAPAGLDHAENGWRFPSRLHQKRE